MCPKSQTREGNVSHTYTHIYLVSALEKGLNQDNAQPDPGQGATVLSQTVRGTPQLYLPRTVTLNLDRSGSLVAPDDSESFLSSGKGLWHSCGSHLPGTAGWMPGSRAHACTGPGDLHILPFCQVCVRVGSVRPTPAPSGRYLLGIFFFFLVVGLRPGTALGASALQPHRDS